jgi:hypothetical protein
LGFVLAVRFQQAKSSFVLQMRGVSLARPRPILVTEFMPNRDVSYLAAQFLKLPIFSQPCLI